MHLLEMIHTDQDKWRFELPWLAFILSYAEGTARAAVAEGESPPQAPGRRPADRACEGEVYN